MTDRSIIGQRIAELRKSKGLTQAELADMIGVSHQAVSQWERNETLPDILTLPIIAEIFGESVSAIMGSEELKLNQNGGNVLADNSGASNENADKAYVDTVSVEADVNVDGVSVEVEHNTKNEAKIEVSTDGAVSDEEENPDYNTPCFDVVYSAPKKDSGSGNCSIDNGFFKNDSIPLSSGDLNFKKDEYEIAVIKNGQIVRSFRGNPDNFITVLVSGNVYKLKSAMSVTVEGLVCGDASSGFEMRIDGDVGGNVSSGFDTKCGDVGGNVNAGFGVNCRTVLGKASGEFGVHPEEKNPSEETKKMGSMDKLNGLSDRINGILSLVSERLDKSLANLPEKIEKNFDEKINVNVNKEPLRIKVNSGTGIHVNGRTVTIDGDYNGDLDGIENIVVNGDVYGDISCENSVEVHGDVSGSVTGSGNVTVDGDVEGALNAGNSASVGGDVDGDVTAGDSVTAVGDIGGNVSCGDNATVSGDIGGNVNAGGYVSADGDISGDVDSQGDVNAGGEISGDIDAEGDVTAGGDICGDVEAGGSVNVEGDVNGDVDADESVTIGGSAEGNVKTRGDVHIEGDANGDVSGKNITIDGEMNN